MELPTPGQPSPGATAAVPPPLPATAGSGNRRPVAGFFVDLLLAIVLLLVLSLAGGMAWAFFEVVRMAVRGDIPEPTALMEVLGQPGPLPMIWMTLFSTGGAALVVYFWRRRASKAERARSHQAARRWRTWGWVLVTGVATFLFSSAISALGQGLDIHPQPSNLALIEAAYAASPLFLGLFGILLAPAYEELLFRRVLFGRLWAAGRPWLGVFLSSTAFALVHEIPGTTGNGWQAIGMLWLTYAFMGTAFALVYWRTRTLWAAIAAHALNNAIALSLLNLYGSQ